MPTIPPFPRPARIALLGLLCLLGQAPVTLARSKPVSIDQPTEAMAQWVASSVANRGAASACKWTPQAAPGSRLAPAPTARQTWMALDHWIKVRIDDKTGEPMDPLDVKLPDNWAKRPDRDLVSAWYVLKVDVGGTLPPTLWLRFDAVAHLAEVFVNGKRVGGHLGAFTPFEFDITAAAKPGDNTIVVYVKDETAVVSTKEKKAISQVGRSRPGEWLSPGGIRGGVYLEAREKIHVQKVRIKTSTRRHALTVQTWTNGGAARAGATVEHEVYEWPQGDKPVLRLPPEPIPTGAEPAEAMVYWSDARRWSPAAPNLYVLKTTVREGARAETIETRFGFREFWIDGRDFVLNGQPIRLFGPSVAREFEAALTPEVGRHVSRVGLQFMKRELNANAIRFHDTVLPRTAPQGADEAGILVINQTGLWSAMRDYYTNGADELLKNMETQIAEWYWRDINSPSVVIWDAENEMIRDERTPERVRWVLALDKIFKKLDPSMVLQHSGDAWYSPTQEVIHLHMQERYAEAALYWKEHGQVPLVFGEFWVGGRGGENRLTNAREYTSRKQWFQEELDLYREMMLEMRYYAANGVMPFWLDRSTLTRTYAGVRHTFDPQKDPVFKLTYPDLRNSGADGLAPAIAIIWPRGGSVLAGAPLKRTVVIANDFESAKRFKVTAELGGERQTWETTVLPAREDRREVIFARPANGELRVTLTDASGNTFPGDTIDVHVIPAEQTQAPQTRRRLVLIPAPNAETAAALAELGLAYETASNLPTDPQSALVIVPPNAPPDALGRDSEAIRQFLAAGGRLLALTQHQAPEWMPLNLPFWTSAKKSAPEFTDIGWPEYTRNLIYSRETPVYAPSHPVFAGLAETDFRWWNERDGRISDDSFVRPATLDIQATAPYRVLVGCTRRENGTVIETLIGAGTAIFCQAQVLEQRAHPAARALLMNLIRHLDGDAWQANVRTVGVVGEMPAAKLATLTGMPTEAFVVLKDANTAPAIVLAVDGADPELIQQLAEAGSTVVVLSTQTAKRLPGYRITTNANLRYIGTRARVIEHPLFWGIASPNFAPVPQTPARGCIHQHPASASVLLNGLALPVAKLPKEASTGDRGLEMADASKPIAVMERRGKGSLIVTTIEPWQARIAAHRQFLTTLLANAGVAVPAEAARQTVIQVKKTVPLRFDGNLNDWTNDMEDSAVSLFRHADPIALTSRDAVEGKATDDMELSGVLYLLNDSESLHVGGIVFSSGAAPKVEVEWEGQRIVLDLAREQLTVGGRPLAGAKFASGKQPAVQIGDTQALTLMRRNPHIGSMHPATETPGRTFETSIAWSALGYTKPPAEAHARVRLVGSNGVALQKPRASKTADAALVLRIEP